MTQFAPTSVDEVGLPTRGRSPMHALRREVDVALDGAWEFTLLQPGDDLTSATWKTVQVPDLWTMREASDPPHYTNVPMPFPDIYPAVPPRNPVGVYRRSVELSPQTGRRVVLHVGAAEGFLRVVVNGVDVGVSSDSHLAAEFDVTDRLVQGTNTFQLSVVKWSPETYLEDQDQWWHSGISRSVHLWSVPEVHLTDVRTVADFDPVSGAGRLDVRAVVDAARHLDETDLSLRVRALGRETSRPVAPRMAAPTLPPALRDRSQRPEQQFPDDFMDIVSLAAAAAQVPPEFRAIPEIAVGPRAATDAPGSATVVLEVAEVEPWSAENPHLEEVLVELLDGTGLVLDQVRVTVGFRRVEVVGTDLLVNGTRILVQGVNRHDLDPRTGRVMTRERFLAELSLLKRFNVNAIRTSHYPNDPVFLDLCDELGFYVVAEADVEGHAFASTIADEPRYAAEILTRVMRLVLRDRNRASVIAWSLGNETGYGASHDAAAAWVRSTDSTRPVLYEGAIAGDWYGGHRASDLVCPMYPSFASLEAYARDPRADRPLILSEYAYSQGNSTGGFAHYWELFERLPTLQGGFVWEFLDHSLDPDGDGRSRYGGDFGDTPTSGPVLLNGLAFADLTPKPAFHEVRGVFSPVRVVSGPDQARRGQVRLRNRRSFTSLEDLTFGFRLDRRSGGTGAEVSIPTPDVAAGSEAWIEIPAPLLERLRDADVLAITLVARTAADSSWAPAGTVLAEGQVVLDRAPLALPRPVRSSLTSAAPDLEHPLLELVPQLSLWRALTDNDSAYALDNRFVRSGFFRLDELKVSREPTDDGCEITTVYQAAYGGEVVHRRHLVELAPGDLLLDEEVVLPTGTHDGLRVGMELHLVPGFDTVSWVGFGPWENYPDRRTAALLGHWSTPIDAAGAPYVKPQETGTRGGVTSLVLSGPAGRVEISSETPLHTSALRWTTQQLEAADHWWELPDSRATVVHVDVAHRGVGTGRIGPDTLPVHRLWGDRYRWQWRLRLTPAS